jgi:hypothetical protein
VELCLQLLIILHGIGSLHKICQLQINRRFSDIGGVCNFLRGLLKNVCSDMFSVLVLFNMYSAMHMPSLLILFAFVCWLIKSVKEISLATSKELQAYYLWLLSSRYYMFL